jgi:hypothetical protein
MSIAKSVPEGLKWVECERGIRGKSSPMCYIPEQDPMQDLVQDTLEKNKKASYFKLTLPNMGNELKVAIWASGTPEQFLLHVHTAIHMCKQLGLDTNFDNAEKAVITVELEAELAKMEYAQVHSSEKKKGQ